MLNIPEQKRAIILDDNLISKFEISATTSHCSRITSFDWSGDGRLLMVCTEDGILNFYDSRTAQIFKRIPKFKQGLWLAYFIRSTGDNCILLYNRSFDFQIKDTVKIWSFNTNQIIKEYILDYRILDESGLLIHSASGLFMIISLDSTINLYSLEQSKPIIQIRSSPDVRPVGAFDTEGLIFAVSCIRNRISLYTCDDCSILKEIRCEQALTSEEATIWSVIFSPDSNIIVILTNFWQLIGYDALFGKKKCSYRDELVNLSNYKIYPEPTAPCFSCDGKFLLCSDLNGNVNIWTAHGTYISTVGPPLLPIAQALQFNPKKLLFCTGQINTILFWQPPLSLIPESQS